MRFVGRGHPSVRATHTKTLELGIDDDITARASCVIAVAAHHDGEVPPAGPLRITVRVCGVGESVIAAVGNPTWDVRGPAVVRRSSLRLPGTLATEADAAAADLPRDLVAALADPATVVEVDVEPAQPTQPAVVLLLADPTSTDTRALRAELAAADSVVTDDAGARHLLRDLGEQRQATAADAPRTLVVATDGLPGASVVALLADNDVRLETVGLTPALAAAAALPSRAPLTLATDDRPRAALRATPLAHRLVVRSRPDDLPGLLTFAAELRGENPVVVVPPSAPPIRATTSAPPELPNDQPVHVGFPPARGTLPLDPEVASAVRGLLGDGVPTRTAARALATLTGRSRRDAYDLTLALGERTDDE